MRTFYLLLRAGGKNMEKKTFEDYIKLSGVELCHEYYDRYNVSWPNKPPDIEIDESLFEAICDRLRRAKD